MVIHVIAYKVKTHLEVNNLFLRVYSLELWEIFSIFFYGSYLE